MGFHKIKLKNGIRLGLSAAAMPAVSACATVGGGEISTNVDANVNEASEFSANRIKADITFLADDLLLGRDTGSVGHRIAANYVAAEFSRLGVKPMGDNGTYFQEVSFNKAKLDDEKSGMTITVGGEEKNLTIGEEYFMAGSVRNGDGIADSDLIYVGRGIHAPEIGIDDYAGIDVEGKIVVVLRGAPEGLNTEISAHYGGSSAKAAAAAKQGAVGMISFYAPETEKKRPFSRYKKYLGYESMDWVAAEGAESSEKALKAAAIASNEVVKSLFEGADVSFADAVAATIKGEGTAVELKTNAKITRYSAMGDEFKSPNVVGVIEGSDPKLKNEYVIMSAHLDHIGVSKHAKDGEDHINNGAMDNTGGVSTLLEVARKFSRDGVKPRRSILFAFVTAEEKGLLGADYFANNPTVDPDALVANVNLDMPILLYDFVDVVAFGAERSSLGPITEAAVSKIGVTLSPDPMPEQGLFTRSDHYSFVKQGIPAVFLMTGFGTDAQGRSGEKMFKEFLSTHYHSPADQIDQDIDYDAAAKFAYVNWLIATAIANEEDKPSWNEGDFFGNTFGKK